MRLRYTLPALADLSAILDYIAANSPQGARRVQARIQALTDLLFQHPHIGRRTNPHFSYRGIFGRQSAQRVIERMKRAMVVR